MDALTHELKNHLHKLIVETDDENILNKVKVYFLTLRSKDVDWWETISDQEKRAIDTGIKQLENSKKIPHHLVRQKANKLLQGK